jgi:hypothetical protein
LSQQKAVNLSELPPSAILWYTQPVGHTAGLNCIRLSRTTSGQPSGWHAGSSATRTAAMPSTEDVSTLVVVKLGQPGGATKGVVRARSAVSVAATDGVLDDMGARCRVPVCGLGCRHGFLCWV